MSESDAPEPPTPVSGAKPQHASSTHSLLYGCLSVVLAVPFGIAYVVLTAAFGPAVGAACAAAIVVGTFLLRRKSKTPIAAAIGVGAAIAFVLFGSCLIILSKS